ncbi:MAG: 3-deoxy-D-manno-octulosonate 8-phosphate phosphatase [Candidatus Electrothrix sp. GM3_4]|nr:3-deoxy-D-manno-octulosonate 8-phosphate phosphatase [Candidatus Electrothrix sp. GM3_4]
MDKVSDTCTSGICTYSDCGLTQFLRERAMKREQPILRSNAWRAAMIGAKKVEVLLLDVDGVLTDGTLFYSETSEETKGFNTLDGFGLRLLREAGIAVGLITARSSEAVSRRAKELKLEHVYTNCRNKREAYAAILEQHEWQPEQTAYMGDDWLDLPVLMQVGCSFAPANAAAEVRRQVDYVTERSGGHGAVREACELILEAKDLLSQLLNTYIQTT